ncbi:PorV/PorQ family protein [candidate division KSB1 bacterium]|nr:PorV/PorQ family protein [candidate division KSB1 bacterium]
MKIEHTTHVCWYVVCLMTICLLPVTLLAGLSNHGATFLQIPSGARQVAMGEAFTGLSYDDIHLMRYNIGGLGSINKMMLAIDYHNWIDDTEQGMIGLALPSRWGVMGFKFNYFNKGEITETDQFFIPTGSIIQNNDIALALGWGSHFRVLNQRFLFGGGLKLIRETLGQESATAFGLDLGALLWLKNISLGASLNNFTVTKLQFDQDNEQLPEEYRAGIGGRYHFGEKLVMHADIDASYIPGQSLRYYTGLEMTVDELFMIRAGYKLHDSDVDRWSAGLGLNIPMEWLGNSDTRLDYTYTPLDAFASSAHRISVLFRFGATVESRALNYPDERKLAELNEQLKAQLAAAEKARLSAEESELRTRALEDTLRARLERIKKIAQQSEGKIEVVESKTPEGEEVLDRVLVSMRINFDFDKSIIRPEDFGTMSQIAKILNTYPGTQVFISGHTDSIGTDEYNIYLSMRRVNSVLDYLSEKENIEETRFFNPIGYGEMRPVDDNGTAEGRFRNRRVDFLIYTVETDQPEIPEGSAIKAVRMVNDSIIHIVANGIVNFTHQFIPDPSRIVIDFNDIFLITERTAVEFNRRPIIRARMGYHPGKVFTRVVIDLVEPVQYDIRAIDNVIVIRIL